jgi:hypothetical protein
MRRSFIPLLVLLCLPLVLAAQSGDRDQFNRLIASAEKVEGFFDLYQTEVKLFMAVSPEQLDRDFLLNFQIARGIGLLLADPRVTAMLVNIHGGGMTRCDTAVEAIHIAMRWSGRTVPMVVRLAGQNAEYARKMMVDRNVPHETAADMAEAVARAVALAKGRAR